MYGSIIFLALDRFSGGGTKFSQVQTGLLCLFAGLECTATGSPLLTVRLLSRRQTGRIWILASELSTPLSYSTQKRNKTHFATSID
jgi:hypothetical protein